MTLLCDKYVLLYILLLIDDIELNALTLYI